MELCTPALRILIEIARGTKTSTTALAKSVGISQQSASRIISALDKEGFVEKQASLQGLRVVINRTGWEALAEIKESLALLDHEAGLTGTVQAGLGEGRYYVSRPEYKNAFAEIIGAEPFPGTLNLRIAIGAKERFVASLSHHLVKGFTAHGRTYGDVKTYLVRANGVAAALIIPERRTHGPDVVELIADVNLRRALQLKDGDAITIEAR